MFVCAALRHPITPASFTSVTTLSICRFAHYSLNITIGGEGDAHYRTFG